jgi:hypothetical protein
MHKAILILLFLLLGGSTVAGSLFTGRMLNSGQQTDPSYNTRVSRPAYLKRHPRVLFDAAHNNADTAGGRYLPFAALVRSDGYAVSSNTRVLTRGSLSGYDVLVIVNASGSQEQRGAAALTEAECDSVQEWVRSGGALLLIFDHAPFSASVADLARRFDVDISKGYTIETENYNKDSNDQTELVFDRKKGLLGEHAITRGRNDRERINRIITFSGTSLKGPPDSVPFLKLGDTAMDVLPPDRKPVAEDEAPPDHKQVSAAGRAQGIALQFGKGRVVVLGEAAMLTAQVASRGFPFGMNAPGVDNRQLALNTMHWLSGLLK